MLVRTVNFQTLFSHCGQISDKIFGHIFAQTLLKQIYTQKTQIRLGKTAKKQFFYTLKGLHINYDGNITQILSSSFVFQEVSHTKFAPYKSLGVNLSNGLFTIPAISKPVLITLGLFRLTSMVLLHRKIFGCFKFWTIFRRCYFQTFF